MSDETVIRKGEPLVTLINVFTVDAADQARLVQLLEAATAEIRKRPGFISANFHASHDGTRVVNYAQWRSREDLEAMLADSAMQVHIREALTFATAEPHLYDVVSTHH